MGWTSAKKDPTRLLLIFSTRFLGSSMPSTHVHIPGLFQWGNGEGSNRCSGSIEIDRVCWRFNYPTWQFLHLWVWLWPVATYVFGLDLWTPLGINLSEEIFALLGMPGQSHTLDIFCSTCWLSSVWEPSYSRLWWFRLSPSGRLFAFESPTANIMSWTKNAAWGVSEYPYYYSGLEGHGLGGLKLKTQRNTHATTQWFNFYRII